jgi:hypothetical protein
VVSIAAYGLFESLVFNWELRLLFFK